MTKDEQILINSVMLNFPSVTDKVIRITLELIVVWGYELGEELKRRQAQDETDHGREGQGADR